MHIIPTGLAPDNRALAEALALGAATPGEQAAVAMLLRLPDAVYTEPWWSARYAYRPSRAGAVRVDWPVLAADVRSRLLPLTRVEHAQLLAVVSLAVGELAQGIDAMTSTLREQFVEAAAHSAGVMLAAPDDSRPEGDGSEPVPAGVDGHPVGRGTQTCIRCHTAPADSLCCSSHNALLCHGCYRRTHHVEVCVPGCEACAREGLDPSQAVTR